MKGLEGSTPRLLSLMTFTWLKEMPLREIYCAMLEQNAFLKELREYAEHEGYVIP